MRSIKLNKGIWKTALFAGLLSVAGCQDSAFVGASGKKVKPTSKVTDPIDKEGPEEQTPKKPGDYNGGGDEYAKLALNCETTKTIDVNLADGATVTVNGEICPRPEGKLSVLFLIDTSGSMANVDNSFLGVRCDRVKATTNVISALKSDMANPNDDVSVGIVRFDTTAQVIRNLSSVKSANFITALNAPRICRNDGWTNYKSAFDLAREQFNGVSGRKVIYFITDGAPTAGASGQSPNRTDAGGYHSSAALSAVNSLKSYFGSELTVNAVFLNSKTGGSERQLLNQITGDANRVKFADKVEELTEKLIELSFPPVVLQQSKTYGELTAQGASKKSVRLSITPDTNRPGVYFYQTEPFVPHRIDEVKTRNELTVTGIDTKGKSHTAKAVINVTHN